MTRPADPGLGFRPWLAAETVSTLGDSITGFALAWAAAGHGAGAVGVVLTAESIPLCALMVLGGAAADRFGIRRVMIACDAAMAVVLAALAVAVAVAQPVWLLAAAAVLAGTAAAMRRPAAGGFPRLFTRDPAGPEYVRLSATVGTCLQSARVAGPAAGGLLLAAGGLSATSAVDATTFCAVAVVLLRVRPPSETAPQLTEPALRSVAESVRAARRTPGVVPSLLAVAALASAVLPLVMLCVPLAGRERHWGPHITGLVEGAWVAGGILITLLVTRRGRSTPGSALAGPLVAAAGVVLVARSSPAWLSGIGIGAVGVGTSLLTAQLFPRFVAATPPPMLARFQSLLGLAQTGPVLAVTPVIGTAAGAAGLDAALALVTGLLLVTAVAARRALAAGPDPAGERERGAAEPVSPSR